jgi:hypothetical protein
VQALDLARGRGRARPGQPLGDAVLPANPLEQHLRRAGLAKPASELLAIVRQHFSGHPINAHRLHERRAHRPAGGAINDGGDHAVPGVIVDPGDDLAFAAAGQEQAGRHIELPQLHRRRAFPPDVLVAAPPARRRPDQPVARQHPVNGGAGQTRITAAAHLEDQAARPPAEVGPAQLANQRLSLRRDPPRVLSGRVRPVSQAIQTLSPVPGKPTVHGLPGHTVSFGDLDNRSPGQDLHNGAVSLLDHVQLPKHERERHTSSGATVSHIKRSRAMPCARIGEDFLYVFKGAHSAPDA